MILHSEEDIRSLLHDPVDLTSREGLVVDPDLVDGALECIRRDVREHADAAHGPGPKRCRAVDEAFT